MYNGIVVVILAGPPAVVMKMISKLLNTQMVRSTTSRPTTTLMCGTVMWIKDCQELAPSIRAAVILYEEQKRDD